jgi:hypothetical protein
MERLYNALDPEDAPEALDRLLFNRIGQGPPDANEFKSAADRLNALLDCLALLDHLET